MITEDYVSFETAKLLKEKGFDEMTELAYGLEHGHIRSDLPVSYWKNSEIGKYKFSCPTLQMTMKWLREVHNIHIELNPICIGDSNEDLEWHYGWAVRTTIFTDRWKRHDAERISYEEACEAAIKYCLENLI